METNEISSHQLRIFEFVKNANRWVSIKDIMEGAQVKRGTAAQHCIKLVKLGIFDQAEVWPGHRYHFSDMAEKRNKTVLERFARAREVFGLQL